MVVVDVGGGGRFVLKHVHGSNVVVAGDPVVVVVVVVVVPRSIQGITRISLGIPPEG